jgi:hypothetical protein
MAAHSQPKHAIIHMQEPPTITLLGHQTSSTFQAHTSAHLADGPGCRSPECESCEVLASLALLVLLLCKLSLGLKGGAVLAQGLNDLITTLWVGGQRVGGGVREDGEWEWRGDGHAVISHMISSPP